MISQSLIRRKILDVLYRCHRAEAFCPLKTSDMRERIGLDDEEEFLKALQFLHDEGYIVGIYVPYLRQGYFESARIAEKGVEVMENPAEMEKLFPTGHMSARVEKFVEDFRREVHGADISQEEKERLLEFIASPVVSDIISRIMAENK